MNESAPTTPPDHGSEALAQALGISFRILRLFLWLAVTIYALSGFYRVEQHERAFVLLFGKLADGPDRAVPPGFHITLPRPFAEVVRVPTERTRTVSTESFWQPELSIDPALGDFQVAANLAADAFGYTLTGDANVLHTQWALRYKIADPETYAFGLESLDEILEAELDHAVIKTSGRLTIDQALRTDIETFRTGVETELRSRVADLGLGAQVERVDMVSAAPPPAVYAAFYAVIQAEQDRSRDISSARADAETTLNTARGDASRIQSEAATYKKQMVDEVSADADYFNKVKDRFADRPEILYRTLLQDTLVRTLPRVEEKFVVHEGAGNQELRIWVSPEPRVPGREPAASPAPGAARGRN